MACACKAGQDIDYLTRKYGPNGVKSKTTNISGDFLNGIEEFFVFLINIVAAPFILVYILFNILILRKTELSISDLLPFSR